MFKNYAPFTICIIRISNTKIDDAQYMDAVTPVYNLIEYSENYSKLEFYFNIVEMYQLQIIMLQLLILLKLMLLIRLILN